VAFLTDERLGFGGFFKYLPARIDLNVSDWSDEFRILNQKSSSESGAWRTSRTPYLKAIMDDLSDHSDVQRVSFMKGAQIGGTEAGNNWIGYLIHHAPGACMVVQPTVDMGKRWSKQRIAPMIEDMECLQEKIKDSRSRDSGNTLLSKEFDGGIMIVSGANSASGLRSMPVKNLMLDEVDAYPLDVDGEGDPVELAINRTKTFARKKIFELSTPTTKGTSRIEKGFNEGDQRHYYMPCPHCDENITFEFKNLHWLKDDNGYHQPETVRYTCTHNGCLIEEHHKTKMMAQGNWVVEGVPNDKHHSYQINSLYSPIGWESWQDIVDKFLKAKNDINLLKTFTNTIEGLPFEEHGDKVDHHSLMDRAEDYPLRVVPMGGLLLTAGVDTQDNRFEITTYAHGINNQMWVVDYHVVYGSPAQQDVWMQLDDYLKTPFPHAAGCELMLQAVAIDSGGHFTQEVYDFCRLRKNRKIIAIKGATTKGKPIISKPSKVDVNIKGKVVKQGAEVWIVGVDSAKSTIYGRLKIEDADADGYIHFSKALAEPFYKQLTSEKLRSRYVKGFLVTEWFLPSGTRNEVLDCTGYALAAAYYLGIHKWRPRQWKQLEQKVQPPTLDMFAVVQEQDREESQQNIKVKTPVKAVATRKPKQRMARKRRAGVGFVSGVMGA